MAKTAKTQSQYERMTQTPVEQLVATLAVPTILSMMVTNVYNLADTAFVGTLGTSASGAVGVVFGFMSILQAIGFLFGQGAGSIMGRKLGAQDKEGAARLASTGFFSALFCAAVVEIICLCNLHPLVMLLGSTDTIAPYAETYIFYILLAAPFAATSFTMNNLLRYDGKAALGMVGIMTGAVLNICGDAVLMFGLHLGIAGAGISTAVSQTVSFLILLSMFLRGKVSVRLSLRSCDFRPAQEAEIAGTGMPSLLRQALNSISTILLNSCAAVYGDSAVAAMSIVSRITFFTFSASLGIGQGYQPVCAFNYGAGKYSRVRRGYRFTVLAASCVLLITCSLAQLFSGNLIGIFRDDAEVIAIGTRALRLQCVGQLALPFCMATEMLLQSTGRKLPSSILSSCRSGLFFVPAILILSSLRGLAGIQEAQPVAFVLNILPTVYFCVRFFRALPKEDRE